MKRVNLFILLVWIIILKGFSQTIYTKKGVEAFYGRTISQDYLKAVNYFEKAVELGDADGAYWLSHCYYFGQGVVRDIAKGDEFLYKAAASGCVKAKAKIAFRFAWGCYEYVGDTKYRSWEKDIQKACKYAEYAALKGDALAQYIMSLNEEISEDERHKWRLLAADGGYSQACFDSGLYYGSKGDYYKSFKYYKKSGLGASGFLAAYYYWGLGVEKDLGKAQQYIKWRKHYDGSSGYLYDNNAYYYSEKIKQDASFLFQKAEEGNVSAQLFIARCFDGIELTYYKIGIDKNQAFIWYERAAMNGSAEAQYRLANMYRDGRLCGYPVEIDLIKSSRWLDKSVEQSYVPALIEKINTYLSQKDKLSIEEVGDLCYEVCKKVSNIEDLVNLKNIMEQLMEIEPQLALLLLKKGIELGDIYSMLYMAKCYECGKNFPMDKHRAFEILNRALRASIEANEFYYRDQVYYKLGRCYQDGIGIERNIEKSIECYKKSNLYTAKEELCRLNIIY